MAAMLTRLRTTSLVFSGLVLSALALASASTAHAAPNPADVSPAKTAWLLQGASRDMRAPLAASALSAIQHARPDLASLTLRPASTMRLAGAQDLVRFAQWHKGLPVIGAGAAARFDDTGHMLLGVVRTVHKLPGSVVPAISADQARDAAQARSPYRIRTSDAFLILWAKGGEARLAYAVVPQVPAGVHASPRLIVDATDGTIIEARDALVALKAEVFPANPLSTPNRAVLDLPMAPLEGIGLKNEFIEAYNCVDKKTVKSVDFFGQSQKIHICDLLNTAQATNGVFAYTPVDDPAKVESRSDTYSEVSMYFHTARAYQFFRDLGGIPTAQVVSDKPLRAVANLQIAAGIAGGAGNPADPETPLQPFSNAFFSPAGGGLGSIFEQLYGFSGGGMWFGQGARADYAYDGDVVYHEFTHAVVAQTINLGAWHADSRGLVSSPGAMNEGLSDYFSSALTGEGNVGEYASKDIAPNQAVIRTLENTDACPRNLVGQVHSDSTLFSGALWQARKAVPEADRRKFDASLYKTMLTHPADGDLGFDDLAKLFVAGLKADAPAYAPLLEAAMTDRGVLPGCDRILTYTDKPITVPPGTVPYFTAPGKATAGVTGVAPGIIQVRFKLPAGATQLDVSFDQSAAGAGNVFASGKPYAPFVHVKFGAPITWTGGTKLTADSDANAEATLTGTTKRSVSFEVPVDSKEVYVQIANNGDQDGTYNALTLSAVAPAPVSEEPVTPPAATPPAASATPAATDDDSCSCAQAPGHAGSFGASALGLGLALAAFASRRRRR
jgi:hypothetical protein